MDTATTSPSTPGTRGTATAPRLVARRVAIVTLAVATADQVARTLALDLTGGDRSGVLATRSVPLGLGASDAALPIVALLAAVGIVAVGLVGLRRAQAGLLPAWVPGFLVGGAASIALDRLAGGAVGDALAVPWSVCTVADLAIVAGVAGWIATDRHRLRPAAP